MTTRRYGDLRGATLQCVAWTPAEEETLRAAYARGGIKAARRALPHRSESSICHRAERMGVQRRRRWTAADDDRLRRLWTGRDTLGKIAKTLGRSRRTTYWRAQKLGLTLGVPAGFEYLHASAKRTGFEVSQLRRILRKARVRIRPTLARPSKRRGNDKDPQPGEKRPKRNRFWMVRPEEVDPAVLDWLKRETVEQHAKRLGVARLTLQRRLEALGGKRPSGKRHWRITDEEARRAFEARLVRSRVERGRYSGARFVEARTGT